jgi:hypothetical protein
MYDKESDRSAMDSEELTEGIAEKWLAHVIVLHTDLYKNLPSAAHLEIEGARAGGSEDSESLSRDSSKACPPR